MNIRKILTGALCGVLAAGVIGCSAAPEAAQDSASAEQVAEATQSPEAGGKGDKRGDKSSKATQQKVQNGDPKTDSDLSDKDRKDSWDPSSPRIEFNGNQISCSDSSVSVDGSTATISQAGTYIVSGSLSDAQIVVSAGDTDDVQLVLDGASLTSSTGSPLIATSGDKLILTLALNTESTVSDASSYADTSDEAPDAAIYAECDLSINGSGTLKVNGNAADGIKTKDDLRIAGGTIEVTAQGNAIKGKDSVGIADGVFTLSAGKDGIESDQDNDTSKGWVAIDGGTFNISAQDDAVSASTLLTVNDGDFDVETGGGSENGPAHDSGFGPGGMMPDFGKDFGDFDWDGQMPDGGNPSQDGEPPALPEGFGGSDGTLPDPPADGAQPPEMPSDGSRPERPQRPESQSGQTQDSDASSEEPAGDVTTSLEMEMVQSSEPTQPSADAATEEPAPAATLPGAPAADEAADPAADGVSAERQDSGGKKGQWDKTDQRAADGTQDGRSDQHSFDEGQSSGADAKGFVSGGDVHLLGGTFNLNCADDAIHGNGSATLTGATLTIQSGDDAVHADDTLTANADITVTTAYEGLEGGIVDIRGGKIQISVTDDGINAAGDTAEQKISISGGEIEISAAGDALDSNGDIEISGGDVRAYSTTMSGGEQTVDYMGDFTISGGTFAGGGSQTGYGPQGSSPQSYVYASGEFKAGTAVSIQENGTEVFSFTPTEDCAAILASFSGCEPGEAYEIVSGSTQSTATAGEGGSGLNESGMGQGSGQRLDRMQQDADGQKPETQEPSAGQQGETPAIPSDAQDGQDGRGKRGGRGQASEQTPGEESSLQPSDQASEQAVA